MNPLPREPLTITDVPYGGRGMGRIGGKVCFVEGVLPDETVQVEITRDRGDFLEARLLEVIAPSPHRIEPACPLAFRCSSMLYSATCPGCTYQHARYETEVHLKTGQLCSLLARQDPDNESLLQPSVAATVPLGYRNKMSLHAQADDTEMKLGYFMTDNTTVLDVPACPLALPALNERLSERRTDASFFRTLRNGMTLTFRWTEKDGPIWWRNRADDHDIWLVESSVIGPLSVPRNSFYQMNPVMADRLVEAVMDRLRQAPARTVVDLYCGVGVFALAAATLGTPQVIGIDLDGPGIRAAAFNARRLGLTNTTWQAADAHEGILAFETGDGPTTFIVDPPRSGLGRAMVTGILKHRPQRILYVSCAADTMIRDAAWLREGGYAIRSSQLFDMFPRTAHFESLTEFTEQ
jgi:tRNA/tmRNA/rRNA uracil-C5-methylase (TrmA/RlmC/RlmD family)